MPVPSRPAQPGEAADRGRPPVSVLIPARNCGGGIGRLVNKVAAILPEIVVVDDGSSDDTSAAASAAGASVVRLDPGMGKGAAMRRGIEEIGSRLSSEWILFMDGDGQHLSSDIPRFLEAIDESTDILLGNRLAESEKFPNHRLVTNRIGSLILRFMTGEAIPDTQCGFRAFRRSLLNRMKLESNGFEIETEMLLKALALGARWRLVPVRTVYEGVGSHYNAVSDTYRISMAALRYVQG